MNAQVREFSAVPWEVLKTSSDPAAESYRGELQLYLDAITDQAYKKDLEARLGTPGEAGHYSARFGKSDAKV